MTLKGKVVALVAVFLTVVPGLCLFFFYGAVKAEMEKENLDRMTSYAKSFERAFLSEGEAGLAAYEAGLRPWLGRVTLVGGDGVVRFDSAESAQQFDNHLNRPEVRAAFKDGVGSGLRYSATLRTHLHYYALKTESPEGHVSFIRVAYPVSALTRVLTALLWRSALAAASITVLSVLFWLWLTNRLFRPLEEIIRRSEQVGTGFSDARFPIFHEVELQRLSAALNVMSERLRNADADIRSRREELARIVEALPIGVLLLDAGLKVRYLNGVTRALFSDRGEVVKGSPVERLIPSGEIYSMLDGPDACGTVLLTPPPGGEEALAVEVRVVPLATGRLMTLRDVTESRRMEETRRNFTIDAGHEFQTPLTAIRAAAELLLDNLATTATQRGSGMEEKKSLLSTILRQQERMTSLIDDLLLLAKLENPSQKTAERAPEDLLELLNAVTDDFRENPSARSVTFELLTSLPSALIMGNWSELLRAVSNVVDNAARKSGEKKHGGKVRLELWKEGAQWVVTVSDNGPGIELEVARRVFKSFQRGPARARWGSEGHGLGLSIAARVIHAHGGSLGLLPFSPLGGAAFEIRLPSFEQNTGDD
jgi:two-component system phosphate regulon sensor histidine kinase PhoR